MSALREDMRRLKGQQSEYERRKNKITRLAHILEKSLGWCEGRLVRA